MSNLRVLVYVFTFFLFLSQFACSSHPYQHGEILYNNFCVNCHMEDGTGLEGNIPPLAGADFLEEQAERVPCIIRFGIKDTIVVNGLAYTTPMQGFPQLTDIEITNIINYINYKWGKKEHFTKPQTVQKALKACQ